MLSIAVATYNVEKYIKESLNSILNQTFTDFELICIDDSSTDNTASIIEEYGRRDNRIRVIRKSKNEGLAVARNESLALARGKYVSFLDGDDIYDETLFAKAVFLAEKNQSDIVYWDYATIVNASDIHDIVNTKSVLSSIDVTDKRELLKRPAFTWTKLIRTQKAKDLNVHFPIGYTRQDIPVHWKLVTQIDNVSILPEILSYYRQQPTATTAKKDRKLLDLISMMDIVETNIIGDGLFEEYSKEFYTQQMNYFASVYDNIEDEYKLEAYGMVVDRLNESHRDFLFNNKLLRPQAEYFLKSIHGDTINSVKYKAWKSVRSCYRFLGGAM